MTTQRHRQPMWMRQRKATPCLCQMNGESPVTSSSSLITILAQVCPYHRTKTVQHQPKYLDVQRTTETDLDDLSESQIEDYWTSSENRELYSPWTGQTSFELLRPRPPVGYSYVGGRLTKTQETTRPANVWLEIWRTLSKKQKGKAIKDWQQLSAERDRERAQRGISHVPDDEVDANTKVLSQA